MSMQSFWAFWFGCVKWAYWRWGKGEPITTSIISYMVTIGGIAGAFITERWWIVLIPLFIMIVFIAPYKMWKPINDRLTRITKKRLEISLAETDIRKGRDNLKGDWVQEWYRVKVHNPTALPISGCYGRLIGSESLLPYDNLPPPGIMFPWSSYGGRNKVTTIANQDADFLDIAVFDGSRVRIVVLDDLSGKRDLGQFPLLIDRYKLIIQIGSQVDEFPPERVIMTIDPYSKKTTLNYASDY
jgi:hypothetical protein